MSAVNVNTGLNSWFIDRIKLHALNAKRRGWKSRFLRSASARPVGGRRLAPVAAGLAEAAAIRADQAPAR